MQPTPIILAIQAFGLGTADLVVLVFYFACVAAIGFYAMRRVRNQNDYFLAGRRFGKVIQIFASFGQATSAETAVSSTTMVSTNGAAGVWAGLAGGLFYMPLVWFWSMWFRRVRLTTVSDIFEERYGSKLMAGFYTLTQVIFLIVLAGLGLVALSKTVAAIALKPQAALSTSERAEYELSREMHQLETSDYASLSTQQQQRLDVLRKQNPRAEFSYINPNLFALIMALVVLLYAGLGGLEGAFLTDLVQGVFLLILSVLLLPFAMAKINLLFGTTGAMGPFHAMHRELPESFFELWGSPAVPEFTWYWIIAYSLNGVFNVAVQANGMTAPASAKDDYVARYGVVVGLFMKRYAMVLWGCLAMMTLVLYGTATKDPDLVWGMATRDLLGNVGGGLVGLMIACLVAALMSKMSAHQMCVSAMLARNIYVPVVRRINRHRPAPVAVAVSADHQDAIDPLHHDDPNAGLSERHMIWAGRAFGIVYVLGGVLVATNSDSIFNLMKFIAMFNAIVAASFWLGMVWRCANRYGAWTSMLVTALLTLILPFLLPAIPGFRSNEYLLRETRGDIVTRTYTVRPADVSDRQKQIDQWDQANARGQSSGERPKPLALGERWDKQFRNPPKSVFWSSDIQHSEGKPAAGQGYLKVELVLLDMLGWDLSKNTYAVNETLSMSLRIIIPFAALMLVSLLSKPEDRERLDRFYVKMKTKVNADPAIDEREMELSYANPHRFDYLKLFPTSNWEFRRWDWDDTKGVIGSTLAAGGCVLLLYLMVTVGR